MKILFVEPKQYFDRLIDIDTLDKDYEVTFGLPSFLCSSVSFLKAYDVVITCIEHSTLSRNTINISKALGIKTVLFMDGTYEFTNATKNPYLKKIGFKLLNSSQFSLVFSPDILMKSYIENLGTRYCFYLPKHAMFKNHSGKKVFLMKKILITTANSAYFNVKELSGLVELIKLVMKTLNEQKIEYKFRIFDENLISKLEIPVSQNDIGDDISTCISKYSHVITTPSTIVYTAIQAEKPTAILLYRDSPITQPAGWVFYKGLDFDTTISDFILNFEERMEFQRRSLLLTANIKKDLADRGERRIEEEIVILNKDFMNISFEYGIRKLSYGKVFKNIIKTIKGLIKRNGL